MNEKIMPCPCCSNNPKIDVVNGVWIINCTHCSGLTAYGVNESEAVQEWNEKASKTPDWKRKLFKSFLRGHD